MRQQGLVCISVYGNVFLGGTLLLLFLDLSRLECCDVVYNFKYASLVIMAPVLAPRHIELFAATIPLAHEAKLLTCTLVHIRCYAEWCFFGRGSGR
jgi:hypothetical protein